MAALSPFAEAVRNADRAQYLSILFAPQTVRDDLFVLHAFDAEMRRIPFLVKEPAMGEIRLQWWREALEGVRVAEASANPLAAAIVDLKARHKLPYSAFDRYLDATSFSFYHDAFPDATALEAWAGATRSALVQMSAIILDPKEAAAAAQASGHAGIVLAVAYILSNLVQTRARGQCYLPQDLLGAAGLDRQTFVDGRDQAALKRATDALAEFGMEHVEKARQFRKNLTPAVRPAFLLLGPARRILVNAARPHAHPARENIALSALATWFSIIRAAI